MENKKLSLFAFFLGCFFLAFFELMLDGCLESEDFFSNPVGIIVIVVFAFVVAIIGLIIEVIKRKKEKKNIESKPPVDTFAQYDTEEAEEDPFLKYGIDPFDNK